MKKTLALILAILLSAFLYGCNHKKEETPATDTTESGTIDLSVSDTEGETQDPLLVERLVSPEYSTFPFIDIDHEDPDLTDSQLSEIVARIPSDRYEAYPSRQNLPLSATLYKNGEVTDIALDDPRLIRLINFFNNALYHNDCAYLLCYLTEELLEEDVLHQDFRLELKYTPYGTVRPGPYDNAPTSYDTVIVTSTFLSFTLINHDAPIMDGSGGILIPFTAASYFPYYFSCGATLAHFGF